MCTFPLPFYSQAVDHFFLRRTLIFVRDVNAGMRGVACLIVTDVFVC